MRAAEGRPLGSCPIATQTYQAAEASRGVGAQHVVPAHGLRVARARRDGQVHEEVRPQVGQAGRPVGERRGAA